MPSSALLQGIFPIQGSKPTEPTNWIEPSLCLLHWQAGSLPLAPPGKPLSTSEHRGRMGDQEAGGGGMEGGGGRLGAQGQPNIDLAGALHINL